MNGFPVFESEFLVGLATAYRKRRRSLSHRACIVELSKAYDIDGDDEHERLEIHIGGVLGRGPILRFHAWADRQVWLDARRPAKKGWEWSWTTEGRMAGTCGPLQFIEAIEETWTLIGNLSTDRAVTLAALWAPHIACGPVAVR